MVESERKRRKVADLLRQLQEAGAQITEVKGEGPHTLEQLRKASRLSDATLTQIEKRESAEFTAWVAWTLRF